MNLILLLLLPLMLMGCKSDNNSDNQLVSIQSDLRSLPQNSKEDLDAFFSDLVMKGAAYTLFGNKPMSMQCYTDLAAVMHPFYMCNVEDAITYSRGWDAWLRCATRFPSQKYCLKRIRLRKPHWHLFLINKPATLTVIQNNLDVFHAALGIELAPEAIWTEMDLSDEFFVSVIKRQDLLGILLGYGKENSCSFQRADDILDYFNQCLDPPFHPRTDLGMLTPIAREFLDMRVSMNQLTARLSLSPHPGYNSLANELNDLERHGFDLTDFDTNLDFFLSPTFMFFKENDQTMELKNNYLATQRRIANLRNPSLLEAIMVQWTGGTQ
jgi:hypothetical protein